MTGKTISLNGKIPPFLCAHPLDMVAPHPDKPGKSICQRCGLTGTIMTKTEAGVLVPKLDLGKVQ
jgi:hypothetical protein